MPPRDHGLASGAGFASRLMPGVPGGAEGTVVGWEKKDRRP
jgi:hypothetical protein